MSSEERLDRLGLLHLRDKPEQLQTELEKLVEKQRREEEAWAREREKIRESKKQEE